MKQEKTTEGKLKDEIEKYDKFRFAVDEETGEFTHYNSFFRGQLKGYQQKRDEDIKIIEDILAIDLENIKTFKQAEDFKKELLSKLQGEK